MNGDEAADAVLSGVADPLRKVREALRVSGRMELDFNHHYRKYGSHLPEGGGAAAPLAVRKVTQELHRLMAYPEAAPMQERHEDPGCRHTLDQLELRNRMLGALNRVARLFLELEWRAAVPSVLAELGSATQVSRVYLFENSSDGQGKLQVNRRFEWAADGVASQMNNPALRDLSLQAAGFGRWEEYLPQGRAIHGPVRGFPPSERSFLEAQGIVSLLVMPIFCDAKPWGFIGFDDCIREREWSPAELDVLRAAANTLGAAIHRRDTEEQLLESQARLREREQALLRQNDQLRMVNRACTVFNSTLDMDEVLGKVLTEVRNNLKSTAASIWLQTEAGDRLECWHASGEGASSVISKQISPLEGIIGWSLAHRQAVAVGESRDDPRHFKAIDREIGIEMRTILAAPMLHLGEPIGVLAAVDRTPNRFGEEELRLLETIAGVAAAAVANARLHAETERLRSQAEGASRAKSAFLAGMSHELRTPLNAILGNAQVLGFDSTLGAIQRARVNGIRHGGENLLLLIEELLDISRVEGERLILLSREVRLQGMMRELAQHFGERARQKGLSFDYQMLVDDAVTGNGVPSVVASDEKRLRQAVANLLDNAVRYTERGEVRLRLTFLDGGIRVEVIDTGPGLPDPETIFEPFREEVMARAGGGLCLGLAVARRMVRLLGGELRLESRVGEGSRFWFEVPVEVVQWENHPGVVRPDGPPAWHDTPIGHRIAPPTKLLELLIDHARGGRIATLLAEANRIQGDSPDCIPFAVHLRELAQGFRIKEIKEWLEGLRQGG